MLGNGNTEYHLTFRAMSEYTTSKFGPSYTRVYFAHGKTTIVKGYDRFMVFGKPWKCTRT